ERGPEVGGEHAHIGALAADDAKRSPRRGDLVDDDRTDDDLPRLAVDLDSLARQLVEPPPRVVDRRIHRRDLLDPAHERPARSRALVADEHAGATDPHAHLADPPASGASGVPASAARTAASTTRVASASGPAIVHPAALRWPPPPNHAAIRCTSTSPLPRRLTFTWPRDSR